MISTLIEIYNQFILILTFVHYYSKFNCRLNLFSYVNLNLFIKVYCYLFFTLIIYRIALTNTLIEIFISICFVYNLKIKAIFNYQYYAIIYKFKFYDAIQNNIIIK